MQPGASRLGLKAFSTPNTFLSERCYSVRVLTEGRILAVSQRVCLQYETTNLAAADLALGVSRERIDRHKQARAFVF